jgi:hypothetical protein
MVLLWAFVGLLNPGHMYPSIMHLIEGKFLSKVMSLDLKL